MISIDKGIPDIFFLNFIQAGVWMGLIASPNIFLDFADKACKKEQNDSAYSSRDQGTYYSCYCDAQKVKEVGAKYSPDNAYDNIANDTKTSSFHNDSGQPARNGTDSQGDDQTL
jgi:hypothetical protein